MTMHTGAMEAKFRIFAPMLKASLDSDGRMRLHGIASSTIKDRHGDTITLSALSDMERAASNNLTIFLNHEYRVPEDVAGSVERALIRSHPQDSGIHDLVLDIVINDANPRAVDAWTAIQKGTQLGLSIGAMIPDGGAIRDKKTGKYTIEHVELLETSLVGVPANPRSWVEYAVKSLKGLDPTEMLLPTIEEAVDGMQVSEGTGVEMEGIEIALGEEAELVVDIEPDITAAKKPAEHQHPHAHQHDHQHDHWNGIVHSHEHSHTHAHSHDDAHEHVDDKQGSEHDHSHVGSYGDNEHPHCDTSKSIEPDITGDELAEHLAAWSVALNPDPVGGDGAVAASQEAPESIPENEEEIVADVTDLVGAPEMEEVESALRALEPTVIASLRTSSDLLKAITCELIDTKKALAEAIDERDQVMVAAEKVVSKMAEILTSLSNTPMGRRTVVREANDKFDTLRSVYGENFLALLKKG